MSAPDDPAPAHRFVEIAVPVPLPGALTYRTTDNGPPPQIGCRVRVSVGPRKLIGVVVATRAAPPDGITAKPLIDVLDLEPVVPAALLQLARFVADYYLAPIGEAVRLMVPRDLPPWGDQRIALTDGGALAPPRDSREAAVIDSLRDAPRQRLATLVASVLERAGGENDDDDLDRDAIAATVERLRRDGRVRLEQPGARAGLRYVKAVELRPVDDDVRAAAVARSPKARAVLDHLAALGRPATLSEITAAASCGPSVVQRLEAKGVLRSFTQPQRLRLDRHRLDLRADDAADAPKILRPDQATAFEALETGLASGGFAPFLLAGMTGSGKTEVYLRLVDAALAIGRTAILLVPEIALVPALARTASRRYGDDLAILHSNLTGAERQQEWQRVRRGAARVVLGPRSALFAPLANLGVIVVDEEHDGAYKQDQMPRYSGRDLALLRARNAGAVAVLVSATPSLESRHNVAQGKLRPLELVQRAGRSGLPAVELIDLRTAGARRLPGGDVPLTEPLLEAIGSTLAAGDQVILLRNRRGFAPIVLCRACGDDQRCADCGLPMTYHRRRDRLICHHCDVERPVPRRCPSCGEAALEPIGAGTERVEQRLRAHFPEAAIDILDADAGQRPGGVAEVLMRFGSGTTQLLVGTQMVAKGHDFPRVALAGVLSADSYLGFPDFRAVEKTYALLTQLAGRAGRGDRPGRVLIQTYHPTHYAIRAVAQHDDRAFADEEMHFRRAFHYPPFTRMVQLLGQHKDRDVLAAAMTEIARALRDRARDHAPDMRLTGPAEAARPRIKNRWRMQILLRDPSGARLRQLVRAVLPTRPPGGIDLVVDVDPLDLM
ncbi:MAG: primosomal protein N' [Acidobacteriota bacterium]